MKNVKILALIGLLALVTNACADLAVTNLNDPDRQRAIQTPGDVESLISGSFNSVFWSLQGSYPVCPLGVAANSHASSWGNWGQKDMRMEPRMAFNNDPSYNYSGVATAPWGDAYSALAGARDGLAAIAEGLTIKDGDTDVTQRAVAFGKFVQGLAHTNIARIYDQAFVIDENTDLGSIELVPASEVFAAGMAELNEAQQIASSNSFTIPSAWVGFGGDWSSSDMVKFIKAFKVRHTIQMPRSPAERDAVDWNWVLTTLSDGLPFDYVNYYDGETWGWHRSKLHCGGYQNGWVRTDYQTLGPADVSGAYETWVNAAPMDRNPFDIVTPDSRITEPMQPKANGKYLYYEGNSPYPASRGIWTFSNYIERGRYDYPTFIGTYPDFVAREVDFIRAEAWYRLGQYDKVREVVNESRAIGDLPPFTTNANPDGRAKCVQQMKDGSCGDLWEALKYEKRIENYHYGSASEYMDDRGWGDLISGTLLELPVPGEELLLLLMKIYTFGGNAGNAAPVSVQNDFNSFLSDFSAETLSFKRQAFDAWLADRNSESAGQVGPRR